MLVLVFMSVVGLGVAGLDDWLDAGLSGVEIVGLELVVACLSTAVEF